MRLEVYFFEVIFFEPCMFLVRGIVDKINEMTNDKVIPIRLQNVMLDSSNSPNEIVRYKFNLKNKNLRNYFSNNFRS